MPNTLDENQYVSCTTCYAVLEAQWPTEQDEYPLFCDTCDDETDGVVCWVDLGRPISESPASSAPYECDECGFARPYLGGDTGSKYFGLCGGNNHSTVFRRPSVEMRGLS